MYNMYTLMNIIILNSLTQNVLEFYFCFFSNVNAPALDSLCNFGFRQSTANILTETND